MNSADKLSKLTPSAGDDWPFQAHPHVLWQNICLALGIKLVFLLLALLGHASMWMAVFTDMGASLPAIFNGLRLAGSAHRQQLGNRCLPDQRAGLKPLEKPKADGEQKGVCFDAFASPG